MAKKGTRKEKTVIDIGLPEEKDDLPPKWEKPARYMDFVKDSDDSAERWKEIDNNLAEMRILATAGLTQKEIADHFNITKMTLWNWSNKSPEIKDALNEGRKVSDERVEQSLYDQCFEHKVTEMTIEYDSSNTVIKKTVKTRVIPANPTCIQFWLTNRNNDKWKAKQQMEVVGGGEGTKPIQIVYDLDTKEKPDIKQSD